MNVGLSVSRVGSAAQTKIMKSVSGGLKGDHAQFRELQAFAQFGTSDLDATTRRQLERGQRVNELLKQGLFVPLDLGEEVAVIFSLTQGMLDDVPVDKIGDFERGFRSFLASNHPDLLRKIEAEQAMSDEIRESLTAAIKNFKDTVPY
jgi:F-type H+-transporting ATPase subunit alpha